MVTPDGELLWSADYDINGRVTRLDYTDFDNPLRFQGQYFDPELDLCYNRNRYYDPHTGSFISQDPIGLAASENVYAYAPNVWGWVDPLGLAKCSNAPKKVVGRTGKQAELRELAEDPKVSLADRGWIKNEIRHIKTGNRKTIRLPGNSRSSRQGGKVLAHERGKRAKDGYGYQHSNLQDTDFHKLEHKYEGY